MTRRTRSTIFLILTSICNILITLFFVILISGGFVFLCLGVFKISHQNLIFEVLLPFVFFASLIVSLKIFMIFVRAVIKIFKLSEKLDPKIINRYCKSENF